MNKISLSNLLLLLVVGLLSLQSFNYYNAKMVEVRRFNQAQNCYKSQVKSLDELLVDATDYVSNTLEQYNQDVYSNKKIDRISEQQLISAEYNLITLQYLALQNTKITSILVNLSVCSGYK